MEEEEEGEGEEFFYLDTTLDTNQDTNSFSSYVIKVISSTVKTAFFSTKFFFFDEIVHCYFTPSFLQNQKSTHNQIMGYKRSPLSAFGNDELPSSYGGGGGGGENFSITVTSNNYTNSYICI